MWSMSWGENPGWLCGFWPWWLGGWWCQELNEEVKKMLEMFERKDNKLDFDIIGSGKAAFSPRELSSSLLRREADLRAISILILKRECVHPGRALEQERRSECGMPGIVQEKEEEGILEKGWASEVGWTLRRHFNMEELFNSDKGFWEKAEDEVWKQALGLCIWNIIGTLTIN